MSFYHQLRAAFRGQIEDFFRVSPRAVGWVLIIIAALILHAVLRINYGVSQFFGWRMALFVVVVISLRAARRTFP